MTRSYGTLFGWLSIAVSALSLLKLFESGFGMVFVTPVAALLAWYEMFLQALVNIQLPWWSETLINLLVNAIRDLVGWEIRLEPHWKHIFVLMWLYFAADLKGAFLWGRPGLALFEFVWGGLVALLSSVVAGSVPASTANVSVLVALVPVLGVALYGLGDGIWRALFYRATDQPLLSKLWTNSRRSLGFATAGTAAFILWVLADSAGLLRALSAPSLTFVLVMTVALAFFWIVRSATKVAQLSDDNAGWLHRMRKDGGFLLGWRMFSALGAAGMVVAINLLLTGYMGTP